MTREATVSLQDIAESAAAVAEYTENMDGDTFLADRKTQDAVARRLMIIGEALTRLSRDRPEVADRIPDLPQAIGLRNYLAHQYDDIDPTTVWDTVVQDLPALRRTVESLICELDSATTPSAETEERKDDDRQPCEPAPFDRTGGTAE